MTADVDGTLLWSVAPNVASSVRYAIARLGRDGYDVRGDLAITSALGGEGVTFVARSMAAVLCADAGLRVCVVETNWWTSHRRNDTTAGLPGLADVLLHDKPLGEVIVSGAGGSFAIVPSGEVDPTLRPALIHHPNFRSSMHELRAQYDVLLLDAPAVYATSAGIELVAQASAYLLVVRHGVTTHAQIRDALSELGSERSIGIVLNRYTSKIPRFVRRLAGV